MRPFRLNRSYDELTPISWREYFDHKRVVEFEGNKFTTYSSGNVDSVLIVLLHGGGFNALTWALFAVSISRILQYNLNILFIFYYWFSYCHHEGAHTFLRYIGWSQGT